MKDAHSLDMKITKFREQEERYQLTRDLPPLSQDEHCIYFMTGERGDGKSNAACALAHTFRTEHGYEVYATGSLLFGRRIAPVESLTFMKSLPRKSVVFTDEAHTILDAYADAAYRNRAASDSVAMMRKRKIIFILASMKEHRVSTLIKEDVQWLVTSGEGAAPRWSVPSSALLLPYQPRGRAAAVARQDTPRAAGISTPWPEAQGPHKDRRALPVVRILKAAGHIRRAGAARRDEPGRSSHQGAQGGGRDPKIRYTKSRWL